MDVVIWYLINNIKTIQIFIGNTVLFILGCCCCGRSRGRLHGFTADVVLMVEQFSCCLVICLVFVAIHRMSCLLYLHFWNLKSCSVVRLNWLRHPLYRLTYIVHLFLVLVGSGVIVITRHIIIIGRLDTWFAVFESMLLLVFRGFLSSFAQGGRLFERVVVLLVLFADF